MLQFPLIFTVGPAPVGERLHVPSTLAALCRLTTLPSIYQRVPSPRKWLARRSSRKEIEVNRFVDYLLDEEGVADDLATVLAADGIGRLWLQRGGVDGGPAAAGAASNIMTLPANAANRASNERRVERRGFVHSQTSQLLEWKGRSVRNKRTFRGVFAPF